MSTLGTSFTDGRVKPIDDAWRPALRTAAPHVSAALSGILDELCGSSASKAQLKALQFEYWKSLIDCRASEDIRSAAGQLAKVYCSLGVTAKAAMLDQYEVLEKLSLALSVVPRSGIFR